MKRYQTTYTFRMKEASGLFVLWLVRNVNDRDYGFPRFISQREVADNCWCVEYSAESELVRGVATGIEIMSNNTERVSLGAENF